MRVLLLLLFVVGTANAESLWKPTVKTDEMTDEVKVWVCQQKPTAENEKLGGLKSLLCAVCEQRGRRGYAFFSDEIILAGDADYRLIEWFASDNVRVYPAKIKSPEGLADIEVFGRTTVEKAWHFVDYDTFQRHALSADKAGTPLLLQLEHYQAGNHVWKYEMTGLQDALEEGCVSRGL